MSSDIADGLVVLGCGSQALYVVDARLAARAAGPVALIDLESGSMVGQSLAGCPIIATLDGALALLDPARHEVVVAHGDNRRKLQVSAQLSDRGFRFATVVHPWAGLSPLATVSRGAIICQGAHILPHAMIGEHAIVHAGAIVEHDCRIGPGANLAPGVALAGRVTVGAGCYLFTGCRVAPKVTIGDWTIVGAGAVVLSSIPAGVTMVGVPARAKKGKSAQ